MGSKIGVVEGGGWDVWASTYHHVYQGSDGVHVDVGCAVPRVCVAGRVLASLRSGRKCVTA